MCCHGINLNWQRSVCPRTRYQCDNECLSVYTHFTLVGKTGVCGGEQRGTEQMVAGVGAWCCRELCPGRECCLQPQRGLAIAHDCTVATSSVLLIQDQSSETRKREKVFSVNQCLGAVVKEGWKTCLIFLVA